MAIKHIPFGYEVSNAEIMVVEREAEVVRNIYSLYVQGCSLKNISERLNLQTVSYAGDGRTWDKNMVKRILENPKYIGEKGYPLIVPKETSEFALKCKEEKCVTPTDSEKKLRGMYREKVRCSICGGKMIRSRAGGQKRRRMYWKCINHSCEASKHVLNEKIIDKLVAQILNEISMDNNIIQKEYSKGFEKNREILVANNEVMNLLSNPEYETEYAIEKIMKFAMMKFSECKEGDNSAVTERIKRDLAMYVIKPEPDGDIIDKVVDKILTSYKKDVCLKLINGKEIERKETDNGCSIYT